MTPYEVLGVASNATPEEIKSAYRAAAKLHHPDLNNNSPESAIKFREIQQAYDELTKPKTQEQRHQRHPFDDHPFSWAFHEFTQRTRSNFDHQAYARVTLEQAYLGCDLTAQIDDRLVTINVPRGIQNGQRLCVEGEGSREHSDLPPGNLYVVIEIAPHPIFENAGVHLQRTYEIDMINLIVGCDIEVETLSGEKISVNVPPRTSPNTKLRVQGKGMPRGDQFGDLYIAIKPVLPNINDDQIERLREIRS